MRLPLLTAIARRFACLSVMLLAFTPLANADGHTEGAGTVLITGANRGIGLEFAKQYADDGWTVIGTARSPDRADELNALDVEVVQLDVTDQESIDALKATLDGRGIDLLINNAGIFPRVSKIDDVDIDAYTSTLLVNTVGPMRITQALMPNLRAGDGKKIVHITSQLASIELAGANFYGYRESKAALNMFSKILAQELQTEGFKSLALHPGWVRTDMGGSNANLSPEESVSGMRAVIDAMTDEDNGAYLGYHGDNVPW